MPGQLAPQLWFRPLSDSATPRPIPRLSFRYTWARFVGPQALQSPDPGSLLLIESFKMLKPSSYFWSSGLLIIRQCFQAKWSGDPVPLKILIHLLMFYGKWSYKYTFFFYKHLFYKHTQAEIAIFLSTRLSTPPGSDFSFFKHIEAQIRNLKEAIS